MDIEHIIKLTDKEYEDYIVQKAETDKEYEATLNEFKEKITEQKIEIEGTVAAAMSRIENLIKSIQKIIFLQRVASCCSGIAVAISIIALVVTVMRQC